MPQDIVKQIHKLLMEKRSTLASAESCTGGFLAKLLTDLPGSSKYFLLGVVSYSNRSKTKILKVPAKLITKYGAASREVALKMAIGAQKLAKSDFAVAITGIAGPTGGSIAKPIGTVFIAVCAKRKKTCKKFKFTGNRERIRRLSALKSLEMLKGQI
ncbi:MAG: nicotinamide-nucleotide amidohydrolase family protein [Candidatus Omnitrophica bacterium]|nr:nicotinamide-nucleotide amidohydrolase family protein [Candidatus Omnitrophota bacterium]MDD5653087.1 nicotinamide-nucleotide amidohydrolase family protein [Candidatus Omnitrophota bacterium]